VSDTWSGSRAAWMDTAPSQWMDYTAGDWMRMAYGDWMDKTPQEMVQAMYPAPRPGAGPWTGPGPRRGRGCGCGGGRHEHEHDHDDGPGRPHRHEHHHDHHAEGRCPRCGPDPCDCFCCIGDVDLAVYARAGEQRVIPIVVENERRRDKQITLDLSNWTSKGGKESPVSTLLLTPRELTLAPCESKEILLVVRASDIDQQGEDNQDRTRIPDVDDCVVAVADLRLEGCDHRPLRIAVAILPRTCDPYRVECGCSCC
jgi:hypothetical protein